MDKMMQLPNEFVYFHLVSILNLFTLRGAVQEEKKKFEKQTAKFVQSQERHLNLSTKKQDSVLQEVSPL